MHLWIPVPDTGVVKVFYISNENWSVIILCLQHYPNEPIVDKNNIFLIKEVCLCVACVIPWPAHPAPQRPPIHSHQPACKPILPLWTVGSGVNIEQIIWWNLWHIAFNLRKANRYGKRRECRLGGEQPVPGQQPLLPYQLSRQQLVPYKLSQLAGGSSWAAPPAVPALGLGPPLIIVQYTSGSDAEARLLTTQTVPQPSFNRQHCSSYHHWHQPR